VANSEPRSSRPASPRLDGCVAQLPRLALAWFQKNARRSRTSRARSGLAALGTLSIPLTWLRCSHPGCSVLILLSLQFLLQKVFSPPHRTFSKLFSAPGTPASSCRRRRDLDDQVEAPAHGRPGELARLCRRTPRARTGSSCGPWSAVALRRPPPLSSSRWY
jgi:hypothetical protein